MSRKYFLLREGRRRRIAARLVWCGFMVVSYLATHVRFRIAPDNPGPNPFDNWRRRTLSNRYGAQVGASLSSSTRPSPSAGRGAIEALKAARRAVPSVPPPSAPPQAASPAAAGDGPAAAAAAAAGSPAAAPTAAPLMDATLVGRPRRCGATPTSRVVPGHDRPVPRGAARQVPLRDPLRRRHARAGAAADDTVQLLDKHVARCTCERCAAADETGRELPLA